MLMNKSLTGALLAWLGLVALVGCASAAYTNPSLKRDPTREYLANADVRLVDQLAVEVSKAEGSSLAQQVRFLSRSSTGETPGPLPADVQQKLVDITQLLVDSSPYLGPVPYVATIDCYEPIAQFTGHGIELCKGLIIAADSEDEIAFVIAHELAHSYLNHTLTNTAKDNFLFSFFSDYVASSVELYSAAAVGALVGTAKREIDLNDDNSKQIMDSGIAAATRASGKTYGGLKRAYLHPRVQFQQNQELAADYLAADLLQNAGYNSLIGIKVMRALADNPTTDIDNSSLRDNYKQFAPSEFQSHPELKVRAESYQSYMQAHDKGAPPPEITFLPWDDSPAFSQFREAAFGADSAIVLGRKAFKLRGEQESQRVIEEYCKQAGELMKTASAILPLDTDFGQRDIALVLSCPKYEYQRISAELFDQGRLGFDDLKLLGYLYAAAGSDAKVDSIAKYVVEKSNAPDTARMKFLYSVNQSSKARKISDECYDWAKKERDEALEGTEEYPDLRSLAKEDYAMMREICSDDLQEAKQFQKRSNEVENFALSELFKNKWVNFIQSD